jgi:xanthine permease XanP
MQKSGGVCVGARPEVVKRATFGISQLIETVAGEYLRSGLIMIGCSFDEFNRDVRVSYEGDMLKLAPKLRRSYFEF